MYKKVFILGQRPKVQMSKQTRQSYLYRTQLIQVLKVLSFKSYEGTKSIMEGFISEKDCYLISG